MANKKYLDNTGLSHLWEIINSKFSQKVDKVNGKGLSTNDYTTEEKNKLAGIAAGATAITVDSAMSSSSTNPVQNKVIYGELDSLKEDITTLQPAATSSDVGKMLKVKTVADGKVTEYEFGEGGGSVDPTVGVLNYVTPEMFGAVGDGVTDDSQAVQDTCDNGYAVYFASNKTYYIPTAINIDHDIHLFGGENTIIKTASQNGVLNNVFVVSGTLKKTTTLTTDYISKGNTANSGNKFTLTNMTDIDIGDIMVITATDQYYNYSRSYYYLGATLLIGDIYDGHLYTTDAMPWDIENTANVSVKIYSAPTAIIENLNFIADMNAHGHYKYLILIQECKNSIIRNCNFTQFDSGICLQQCVNTLVDGIQMSKSEEVEVNGDGYSLLILSCSDTIVERMMTICSQAGVSLSGTIPNLNTYVRNSNLASECRRHGVACHENSYNIVIEDCVLAGLNVLGTGEVNRCRFINNQRTSSDGGITFCGSHNPDWAVLRVKDCVFESVNGVFIYNSSPQTPIQAYDNIVGLVEITDCKGGQITYQSNSSQYTLSNVIKNLRIVRWADCYEIYHPNSGDIIENLIISDCTFIKQYWINDHHDALLLDGVYNIDYTSTIPMQHKISANKTVYADKYVLPENISIVFSSNNSSAQHIICGNNLMPNDPNDLVIGSVSGSTGETLTRTKATDNNLPTITQDADGNIVYTQANNTSSYSIYPVGMFYVNTNCIINMSAKIKNTGTTSGAAFKPYIAVVDCSTGKIVTRSAGTTVEATAQGANMSFTRSARSNSVAMCYMFCNTAVVNAETTFENFVAYTADVYAPSTPENIGIYTAKHRTGNGSIMSIAGVNNIMSSETTFGISFTADLVNNPIGLLPSALGVSF